MKNILAITNGFHKMSISPGSGLKVVKNAKIHFFHQALFKKQEVFYNFWIKNILTIDNRFLKILLKIMKSSLRARNINIGEKADQILEWKQISKFFKKIEKVSQVVFYFVIESFWYQTLQNFDCKIWHWFEEWKTLRKMIRGKLTTWFQKKQKCLNYVKTSYQYLGTQK